MPSDAVGVIEAGYRLGVGEVAWLEALVEAARPTLDLGYGILAYNFDASCLPELKLGPYVERGTPPGSAAAAHEMVSQVSPEAFRRSQLGPPVNTLSNVLKNADDLSPDRSCVATALERIGKPGNDCLAVTAHDPVGIGCVLVAVSPTPVTVSPGTKKLWGRLAAHIIAGHRLRRFDGTRPPGADAFDGAEAILDPEGRVQDATKPAQPRAAQEALREAARAQMRACGKLRRSDPAEAIGSWRALVAGRWSLVDHFDHDGRRFLIARKNDPKARALADLSPRERLVVGYACLGHSNKLIAYELGLAQSTIAMHLSRAAARLGARSRADLIRICRDPALGLSTRPLASPGTGHAF